MVPPDSGSAGTNNMMIYNSNHGKNQANIIATDSTHANSHSDAAPHGAQKRLRSQQNYAPNMGTNIGT